MSNNPSNSPTLLGYTNRLTVRPDENIEFKISAAQDLPYRAQLVRLINGAPYTNQASFKEVEINASINGEYQGRWQSVAPGSCVVIDDTAPLENIEELSLVVTFMPTTPEFNQQHIISRWDEVSGTGWSLHITAQGQLAFTVTNEQQQISTVCLDHALKAKHWYKAALRLSWAKRCLDLQCIPLGITATHQMLHNTSNAAIDLPLGRFHKTTAPLIMAAAFGGRDASARIKPVACFNGRLEAPVIYQGWLSDTLLASVLSGDRPVSLSHRLIGDWDFSQGIGSTQIYDQSPNCLMCYTHNLPSRAVKASGWKGVSMDWTKTPDQYAAIHFHSDDLYDCGWQTDITYRVPDDLRSGIYALRLRQESDVVAGETGQAFTEDYLPFFVAAPRGKPQAKVAFIVPTHTYLAYGNIGLFESMRQKAGLSDDEFYGTADSEPNLGSERHYGKLLSQHDYLAHSTYDRHLDGSPMDYSSWLRPLLNIRPKGPLWTLNADLLLVDWLQTHGFEHDIITDDLLQEEGVSLLKNYSVVISGNHPEYTTTQLLDAMEAYTAQGGRFMYMGGNGYYWRSAVHTSLPGVLEVRRGRNGTASSTSNAGEDYLEFSGEMGGLWRDLGRPPQQLVGVGYIALDANVSSYYQVLPEARTSRAAFILEGVDDDIVGDFGLIGGGAAGFEIDRSNPDYGTPEHAVVLARSSNHNLVATNLAIEERALDDTLSEEEFLSQAYGEVVFFEVPNGGAVFSVGSMAWVGSLSHNNYNNYNNTISTITHNVLARFCDPTDFIFEDQEI